MASEVRDAFDKWAQSQQKRLSSESNLAFGAGFKAGAKKAESELAAAHARLSERLGEPCEGCNPNTGPSETCAEHGRTLADWRNIADKNIRRANEAEAKLDRVTAACTCGATDE